MTLLKSVQINVKTNPTPDVKAVEVAYEESYTTGQSCTKYVPKKLLKETVPQQPFDSK